MAMAQQGMGVAAQREQIKATNEANTMNYERAYEIAQLDTENRYAQEQRRMMQEKTAAAVENQKMDNDLNEVLAELMVDEKVGGAPVKDIVNKFIMSKGNYDDAMAAQLEINRSGMFSRQSTAAMQNAYRAHSTWKPEIQQSPLWYNALKIGMAGVGGYHTGVAMQGGAYTGGGFYSDLLGIFGIGGGGDALPPHII